MIRKKMTSNKMCGVKKSVWAWLLALLILSIAGAVGSLQAQERPSPPQRQTPTGDSARKHEGVGEQLARETREASGEEKDETAEFKQSGSVRLVARLTGMSLEHAYWLSVLLNFVVIAALILWGGRKYLPGMFRDRTLAIQKRSSEVWAILGAVKSEFGKFGDILTGVRKRLQQASDTIDDAVTKTRTIERKLRGVQELPTQDAEHPLGTSADPVA